MKWEKESMRLWSFDGGIMMVPFFQLIIGFMASSQGCPRIVFSFPPLMT